MAFLWMISVVSTLPAEIWIHTPTNCCQVGIPRTAPGGQCCFFSLVQAIENVQEEGSSRVGGADRLGKDRNNSIGLASRELGAWDPEEKNRKVKE